MDDVDYVDVAFSFNALDEGLATQLNDLLSDRMKTFIYSERQRDIAGKDGQEKFSDIYGKAARLVVVLFRPEWGETPWTRVEQGAIRQRAFDEGWDFTTFIPTVQKPTMPKWLPKTRWSRSLWIRRSCGGNRGESRRTRWASAARDSGRSRG